MPQPRTVIVPFIDQRERFCTLLDHPTIHAIAAGLLETTTTTSAATATTTPAIRTGTATAFTALAPI